jgi:hypothetical protein
MKTKYLAINKEKGVFLGTYSGYAFFAKTDPTGMSNAYAFDDENTARFFLNTNLPAQANSTFFVPIDSKANYVSVVDIIKAGYGDYTYKMMDALPMVSTTVH